jgi:hypothetical protein
MVIFMVNWLYPTVCYTEIGGDHQGQNLSGGLLTVVRCMWLRGTWRMYDLGLVRFTLRWRADSEYKMIISHQLPHVSVVSQTEIIHGRVLQVLKCPGVNVRIWK